MQPPAPRSAPSELAGLRRWSDGGPAIVRRRSGRGFTYRAPDGTTVRDRAVLDRIRALAIPPAWTDVRICPDERGHVQATGRDSRGRKQYRYHPRWRMARDAAKFGQLVEFGAALPRIRARVSRDLARPGLPRDKVLALVVSLLDATLVRIGNASYAEQNRSFGLTTLRKGHVRVVGSTIHLRFHGKSGRVHEISHRDRRLARLVRRCRELPGRYLFQYVAEDGDACRVRSDDVNEYLRLAANADVTAKMFRTWAATVLADAALRERAETPGGSTPAPRKAVGEAMRLVADRLGNTPTVAREAYVHPAVIEAFTEATLPDDRAGRAVDDETATLRLLRARAGVPSRRREAVATRSASASAPGARPRRRRTSGS